jgi:hypothetical protein
MTYTVRPGQSLMDSCLMMAGTLEALNAVAQANGLAATDEVTVGQELVYPEAYPTDKVVREAVNAWTVFGSLGPAEVEG